MNQQQLDNTTVTLPYLALKELESNKQELERLQEQIKRESTVIYNQLGALKIITRIFTKDEAVRELAEQLKKQAIDKNELFTANTKISLLEIKIKLQEDIMKDIQQLSWIDRVFKFKKTLKTKLRK